MLEGVHRRAPVVIPSGSVDEQGSNEGGGDVARVDAGESDEVVDEQELVVKNPVVFRSHHTRAVAGGSRGSGLVAGVTP